MRGRQGRARGRAAIFDSYFLCFLFPFRVFCDYIWCSYAMTRGKKVSYLYYKDSIVFLFFSRVLFPGVCLCPTMHTAHRGQQHNEWHWRGNAHMRTHKPSLMHTFPRWYQSCQSWWPEKCSLQCSNKLEKNTNPLYTPISSSLPPSLPPFFPFHRCIIPLSAEGVFFVFLFYWLSAHNCFQRLFFFCFCFG